MSTIPGVSDGPVVDLIGVPAMMSSTSNPRTAADEEKCRRLLQVALLLFPIVLHSLPLPAFASEATQCANAKNDDNPDTCELWVNGNINHAKAIFFEGEVIPYRVVIDPAVPGQEYQITVGWDAIEKGKNALDYIATYNESVTKANPCDGFTCDHDNPSYVEPIPADTEMQKGRDRTVDSKDDVYQIPGAFTAWGGNIIDVGPYVYPSDFDYSGSHEITITLKIEATAETVVLAWGGHIASRIDWGNANGVVNLSGSSYHSRASGQVSGIQGDLVLATSAVIFPSYVNVTKEADRATLDDFSFYTDGMADEVDGEGSFTLKHGDSIKLMVDGYSRVFIEEDLVTLPDYYGNPLWELDEIVCADNEGVPVPFERRGDRIDFSVGEALLIDCYFRNVFIGLPNLELVKKVIPASESCVGVNFDGDADESLEVASGDSVRYCYRLRNNGNDVAYDLFLEDDAGSADVNDDFRPLLSGGDLVDLGKDGAISDLGVAGQVETEEVVSIELPVGESVTNTAIASAIDYIDTPIADSDTATVNVTTSQVCQLTAGVSKTGDCADAVPVLNVVEGMPLTWCADLCMESGNSDLLSATFKLREEVDVLDSVDNQTLAEGSCTTWSFGETAGSNSHARILSADGADAYGNTVSCGDNASANVFDPNLAVSKTISLDDVCGDEDDTEYADVYYGDSVWYCFTVTNIGTEGLESITLIDQKLNLGFEPFTLASGESWGPAIYGPVEVTDDILNTARADAVGTWTDVPVHHEDSADVTMLFADIVVSKNGTDRLNAKLNETMVNYSIAVTNEGNVSAMAVTLMDTLPDLVEFVTFSPSSADCTYDSMAHTLECNLGDIPPDETVTIEIAAELVDGAPIFGFFENLACAEVTDTSTPDTNDSNNCDDHTTAIVPGATRTIGYWQNHPDTLEACLALDDNTVHLERADAVSCGTNGSFPVSGIDLGYVKIADEACDGELDARISTEHAGNGKGRGVAKDLVDPAVEDDGDPDLETGLELALGVLKALPSSWEDGTKRSELDSARTKAGRQVLAVICNTSLLGALRPDFLDNYIDVLLSGEIDEILALGAVADIYNNSGDSEPISSEYQGSADPFANNDDPSDPTD